MVEAELDWANGARAADLPMQHALPREARERAPREIERAERAMQARLRARRLERALAEKRG